MEIGYRHLMALAALVAALFIFEYKPVLDAGFVYQDRNWLDAADQGAPGTLLSPRSLARWSFYLQRNYSAAADHLTDLTAHTAVSFAVLVLALNLGMSLVAAALAASIMLLHPINVEGATYLSARTDLIATVGMVVACARMAKFDGSIMQAVGIAVCSAVALAGKETAIALAVLLPLSRFNTRWVIVGFAAVMVACIAYAPGVMPGDGTYWHTLGAHFTWAGTQSYAAARMLGNTLMPWPSALTVDYDYSVVPVWWQAMAVSVFAIAAILAVIGWRRVPLLAFGWVWVLAFAIPRMLVLTPNSQFNEHQFYGAVPGIAIVLASLVTGDV